MIFYTALPTCRPPHSRTQTLTPHLPPPPPPHTHPLPNPRRPHNYKSKLAFLSCTVHTRAIRRLSSRSQCDRHGRRGEKFGCVLCALSARASLINMILILSPIHDLSSRSEQRSLNEPWEGVGGSAGRGGVGERVNWGVRGGVVVVMGVVVGGWGGGGTRMGRS